jgi:hypothetical protein
MNKKFRFFLFVMLLSLCGFGTAAAQTTTASISGTVTDERQAVVPGASVTARNTGTGITRTAQTDGDGRYNLVNLPIGAYEVTVEAANFSRYVQSGITLVVNQNAVVDVGLKAGSVQEIVTVTENASLLNTTTPEVSTRFDGRRLSELPIAPNRNVYNVLLSVPGVSQLGSGQSGFTNGINFSSNGGRLRSNNFMIDGQDINDPSVAGGQIQLNNPDAIQEVRIITNQFLAEYGRNSGSVVNFVGKSGTNEFHGSGFVFHNNENLNACSNLDKRAAIYCNPLATDPTRREAPLRKEFQYGFTFGGPLTFLRFGEGGPTFFKAKDRTFFFIDFQRWTDRAFLPGTTISGAPTAAGRAILQQFANRPQVAALLEFLPAGTPNGRTTTINIGGVPTIIPLGDVTGAAPFVFNDKQGSFRIDHRFSDKHLLYGRYRANSNESTGTGQATPPGLTNVSPTKTKAATIVLNSILSNKLSNEARIAWTRYDSSTNAQDPRAESIPSIEVPGLGLTGFNAGATRTALGLGVNLPQFRINDTYQIQNAMSYTTGDHNVKIGLDTRRTDVKSFFFPTVRGRLSYATLQTLIDDVATVATINLPLRGGDIIGFYRWYELYGYAQDEWRVKPNLSLTFGVRYEYPGDSFGYLKDLNRRILAANGNNSAFIFAPSPKVDRNNVMPRVGFAYTPRTGGKGILGFITGDDQMVIRGGYARTYDANFININLNVFSSFPFVAAINVPSVGAVRPNAFATLRALQTAPPNVTNPIDLARTVVSEDFRSPATDQFSLEVQRELSRNAVLKVGYIRTRGTGLFQTVDGNPRLPFSTVRANPNLGVVRLRTNSAESTYDALQVSFDKRLSNNFSAGFHYTYSSFIDDASELFNPSNAEVAVAQDSFNRAADRARSSFDRPHRFTGNFVYELPFFREQRGFIGHVLGGFQINSFFTFQSGAPFTVLLGEDPTGALSGIDGLVGNAIRPNVVTNLDLSSMTLREIRAQCGAPVTFPGGFTNNCPNLFSRLAPGQRVGNAGRNILRSDGIKLVDFGIIKNTRISESVRFQLRADMFNVFNTRNLGVPEGRISAQNFLDEGGTNGGNRRIVVGARLVF